MADQNTESPSIAGPMSRRGKRPNLFVLRFPRLVRTLRVVAFGAVVLAIAGGFQLRQAHSQMGEQLLDAGQLLMGYANAERQDGARTVLVNGESMHFSTGVTHDSPHTLLEQFTAMCDAHDGGSVERFTALPAHFGQPHGAALDPVYRYETDAGGVIACLDLGEQELSLAELHARVRAFEHSHDMHDIGDVRYAYAQAGGEDGLTHFVTAWTEGSFRIDHMVAQRGHDAGGTDLENVPRPPGAYRTMSAAEVGNPDSAVQYAGSSMSGWQLEGYYERALVDAGWTLTDVPENAQPRDTRFVQATRDDAAQIVFVALSTQADGRGTATIALSR